MEIILFCDLDGTLVAHHSYKVNKLCISTIHNFVKKGNQFVIATGRWINRVMPIVDILNFKNKELTNYIISLAGACIWDLKQNKIIYEKVIENEIFSKLQTIISTNKLPGIVYSKNSLQNNSIYVFKLKHKWLLSKFAGDLNFINLCNGQKVENAFKIIIPFFSQKKRRKILNLLKPLENYLNIMPQKYYIEILHKDVSKATAAEFLINYLNLQNYTTAAIGDSANDVDILNYVNRSFIVAPDPHNSQLQSMNLPIINNKDYVSVARIINMLIQENEGSKND